MDKTDEQLAEILKKGLEAAEKTGSFIIEQAPDIIQQLILWKTVQYSASVVIGVFVLYMLWKKYSSDKKKTDYYDSEDYFLENPFRVIIYAVVAAIGIGLTSDVYNLIQIIFAPKIFLIEYASKLLN